MNTPSPQGPTIPSSTNFLTNFTRLLKVTDSITGNSFSSPNPSIPGFNTTLSGGRLSNLNNPILDSQGATYDYALLNGGSAIPSGPINSVQYNNGGVFGGSASLTFNDITNTLNVNQISNGTISIGSSTISGLTDPVTGTQAATKNYVDNSGSLKITTDNTIGSTTYNAVDMINGIIYRDTQTAGITIDLLPTAAQIISAAGASVGSTIYFSLKNINTDYTNVVKFSASAGITYESDPNIFSGYQFSAVMIVTNVSVGTEALTMYILNNAITNTVNWGVELGALASTFETARATDAFYVSTEPRVLTTPDPKIFTENVAGKINYINEATPQTVTIQEPDRFMGVFIGTSLISSPFIWKSGGIDFYIMNLSTSTAADVTVDGSPIGSIPWTIDPNSNMTIPPGHTGWFMIYLTVNNYPELSSLTSAKIYTLGIFPN